ncbi:MULTISPECIES: hypothetical protein [unclassified Streptomyces]|uniref:hypothetical protein n=1 Tax=unclassified Streptomyces TaxID=2593676 RepID=UPI001BE8C09D|nr:MULTISPECIES: hypothetical protein [unclassified Streptomyces]MBT2403843.1 hypothetical protein [Streptomyces sp. ISL-21]MBT2613096.1 hypothetical protein [Streptomyces sp. ISL-87]
MSTVSRRTLVRAAAVTTCAGSLLVLPAAAALAEGVPARILVKNLSLADGASTAQIYWLAQGAYQAEILHDGATVTTLTSRDGAPGASAAGELHAALQPDGHLSSWVGDTRPAGGTHAVGGEGHKTGTRHGPASTQPQGGGTVAAAADGPAAALRLNTLADAPGDGMLLLAAGSGIAAVGAAGLGFAMLRRGRTNG